MGDASGNDPMRPGLGLGDGMGIPRPRRRMPGQMIVLVLVVGVSAGALYGMRRYGMQSGFNFIPVQTDISTADTQKAQTYERIMADLASVQRPLDVALGDFGKSPFMHEAPTNITPKVENFPPAQSDAERHRQEAYTALKTMHLNGIIGNIARIDDMTVKAGDKIGDIFEVKSVEGRTVTFEAYGEEFKLEMEVKKPQSPKGSPTKMRALQDRR
jgi:hypothetical protein